MFFSIFIVYTAVQNQVNRALETSSRITALLATHGSSITNSLPHISALLDGVITAIEGAVSFKALPPPSSFNIQDQFQVGQKMITQPKNFFLVSKPPGKKAEPSLVSSLSFHKSASMQQNPCCCAQTIYNNNKK